MSKSPQKLPDDVRKSSIFEYRVYSKILTSSYPDEFDLHEIASSGIDTNEAKYLRIGIENGYVACQDLRTLSTWPVRDMSLTNEGLARMRLLGELSANPLRTQLWFIFAGCFSALSPQLLTYSVQGVKFLYAICGGRSL